MPSGLPDIFLIPAQEQPGLLGRFFDRWATFFYIFLFSKLFHLHIFLFVNSSFISDIITWALVF